MWSKTAFRTVVVLSSECSRLRDAVPTAGVQKCQMGIDGVISKVVAFCLSGDIHEDLV
jgi:hypothetical protein